LSSTIQKSHPTAPVLRRNSYLDTEDLFTGQSSSLMGENEMFTLFSEHLAKAHQQELLKQAAELHLAAQARESRRNQDGRGRRSISQTVRLWIYAGMDWSGSRLIQFGSALRKAREEAALQDQAQPAEVCQSC
jgi:hypothetical protein